jgi:hypothetical protein
MSKLPLAREKVKVEITHQFTSFDVFDLELDKIAQGQIKATLEHATVNNQLIQCSFACIIILICPILEQSFNSFAPAGFWQKINFLNKKS